MVLCLSYVLQAEVKANRTAVVSYRTEKEGNSPAPGEAPYLFSGEKVILHQGYLIWLPFSIPNPEVRVI